MCPDASFEVSQSVLRVSLNTQGQNRPNSVSGETLRHRYSLPGRGRRGPTNQSDFDGAGALLRLKGYRIAQIVRVWTIRLARQTTAKGCGLNSAMSSFSVALQSAKIGEISVVTVMIFCGNSATKWARNVAAFSGSAGELRIDVFGILLDGEEDVIGLAEEIVGDANFIGGDFKAVGPVRAALVRGGHLAVGPILLSPWRFRHR